MILVFAGAICGILLASVMLWAIVYVGARQEKRLIEQRAVDGEAPKEKG